MYRKITRAFIFVALLCTVLTVSAFAESAVVTGSDVNFRSGPGSEYEVTECLAKGTVVTVNDRSNPNWYCVTFDGRTGFMSSSYLKINEETTGNAAPAVSDGGLLIIGGSSTPAAEPTEHSNDPAPTPAPETAPSANTQSGYITGMYVRFRSGPSTDYSILGEYNKGTALTVMSEANGWSAVVINGVSGYVCSDYVAKNTAETGTSSPTPTSEPVETAPVHDPKAPGADLSTYPTGTIKGSYVRFRSGPGNTYSIYGMYDNGTPLYILGVSGDWTNVNLGGQNGYVFSTYVLADGIPSAPEPTQAPEPTVTPVSQTAGYITGNNVRFRSGASTSSDILGEYNYGTVLTVTGASGDWKAVTINGKNGYVYSQYVAEGTVTSVGQSTSSSDLGTQIAQYALQFVGCNYVWGGTSPDGFDCSGFVQYVYTHFGIHLKRVACDQATQGIGVDTSGLQCGDVLCFYSSADYIGHVGIYIGDGKFVHASTSTTGVIISELSGYYTTRGFEARRMI